MLPPLGADPRARVPTDTGSLDRAYNAQAARLAQLQATIHRLIAPRIGRANTPPAYVGGRPTIDPLIARYGLGGIGQNVDPLGAATSNSAHMRRPVDLAGSERIPAVTFAASRRQQIPVPSLWPPAFIPGTPENRRTSRSLQDAIQGAVDAVGNLPIPSRRFKPDYDEECQEQLDKDLINCQILGATKGRAAYGKCKSVAMDRYSECLKWGVNGTRTPPYWGK